MTEDEFRKGPKPDTSLEPAGYFVTFKSINPSGGYYGNGLVSDFPPLWAAKHNHFVNYIANEAGVPPNNIMVLLNFWPLTRAQFDEIIKTGEVEQV